MKVKMLTNFKTVKYGFLNNQTVYDLNDDDALNFIKKRYAEIVSDTNKNVISNLELKIQGAQESIKLLKTEEKLKEKVIVTNTKDKEEKKQKIDGIKNKYGKQIADLEINLKDLEKQKEKNG